MNIVLTNQRAHTAQVPMSDDKDYTSTILILQNKVTVNSDCYKSYYIIKCVSMQNTNWNSYQYHWSILQSYITLVRYSNNFLFNIHRWLLTRLLLQTQNKNELHLVWVGDFLLVKSVLYVEGIIYNIWLDYIYWEEPIPEAKTSRTVLVKGRASRKNPQLFILKASDELTAKY